METLMTFWTYYIIWIASGFLAFIMTYFAYKCLRWVYPDDFEFGTQFIERKGQLVVWGVAIITIGPILALIPSVIFLAILLELISDACKKMRYSEWWNEPFP